MNVLRGKVVLKETSAGIPDLIVVVEDVHAVRWAEANGADLARLRVRRPSPEDIYLSLTQTRKEAAGDCARCLRPRSASASGRLDGPLAWHQFHYDLRAFFRNRRARFFTLALPVLFLGIFASVFTGTTKVAGGSIDTSLYYVPVIITPAITSAAFGNLGPRPGPLLLHT